MTLDTYFDKLVYKAVRYGIFLSAFIPLIIFRNAFSPFNFGKVVVFRTFVEILLALYIYLAIKYKNLRPKMSWIFIALTLFTFSFALSAFLGVNSQNSFWGSFERMGGLFSWFHYYALFIILISIFKTKQDWFTLLKLSIFASLISVIYGFLQKFNIPQILGAEERVRIFGTLGNAAAFGGYLIFNIYFALFFLISRIQNIKYKILNTKNLFYLSVIVIESIAVVMTAVRGAVLALFLTLFIFGIWYLVFKIKKYKVAVAILLLFIIGVVIFINYADKLELQRLTNFSLNQPTIQSRLMVWQGAITGVKEKPFLGWGPENFEIPYAKHYNPKLFHGVGREVVFDRAHNIFLDIGATLGILGLVIYLFLWGAVILGIRRLALKNKEFKVLYFLIIAYFIHNFFFFDLFSTFLMGIFVIGLIQTSQTSQTFQTSQTSQTSPKLFYKPLLIILLILAIFLAYQTNIKPALANFYSTRGAVALSQDKYEQGVDYFEKALNYSSWAHRDIRRKFTEYYIDTTFRLKGRILEKDLERDLNYLIEELEKEKQKNRLDYLNYHYLHKAYRAKALFIDLDFSQSEQTLDKAIILAPNMIYLYYDLAELKYYQKEYSAGLEATKKAYNLNPDWSESKFKLGQAYVLDNQIDKGGDLAIEAVKQGYTVPADINWLGKELEKMKDYQKLIDLFEYLSNQVNPQYKIQLSYSYLLAGELKKAERVADEALDMDIESMTRRGFELLAEIYKALGNEEKRAKAAAKAFGIE